MGLGELLGGGASGGGGGGASDARATAGAQRRERCRRGRARATAGAQRRESAGALRTGVRVQLEAEWMDKVEV